MFMGEQAVHQCSAERWRLQNAELERACPRLERRTRWRLRNAKLKRPCQRPEACVGDPAGQSSPDTTLQPVSLQEVGVWDEVPLVSHVCAAFTEDAWEDSGDVKLEEPECATQNSYVGERQTDDTLDASCVNHGDVKLEDPERAAKNSCMGESETDDAIDSTASDCSEWEAGSEYTGLASHCSSLQKARSSRAVANTTWADVAKRAATATSSSAGAKGQRTTLPPPVAAQAPCRKVSIGPTSCFDGLWAGRGEVRGKTFFWKDGPRAPLRLLGNRELELRLDGRRHRGVLKDDGRLHWDDGDVWSRETLDGVWAGRGEVEGKMLFWKDGPSIPLRLIGDSELELTLDGRRHRGMLRGDGNLHWEDGDIWTREGEASGSSGFGFQLHSEVQLARGCDGVPAGEVGKVVGFTSQHVEVKFLVKILRCLPADLKKGCAAPSAWKVPQARSSTDRGSTIDRAVPRQSTSARREKIVDAALGRPVAAAFSLQEAPLESSNSDRSAQVGKAARHQAVATVRRERPAEPATGKLCASGTSIAACAAVAPRAAAGNTWAVVDSSWYTGVAKYSRGSMAWLQCKALQGRFPEQDIFLHRTECRGGEMPRQWDRVSFRLAMGSDGNPRAVQARPEEGADAISAADWFAARRKL